MVSSVDERKLDVKKYTFYLFFFSTHEKSRQHYTFIPLSDDVLSKSYSLYSNVVKKVTSRTLKRVGTQLRNTKIYQRLYEHHRDRT